jgi:hypothetical protein
MKNARLHFLLPGDSPAVIDVIVQCRMGGGSPRGSGIFLVSKRADQYGKDIPVPMKTVSIKSTCRG